MKLLTLIFTIVLLSYSNLYAQEDQPTAPETDEEITASSAMTQARMLAIVKALVGETEGPASNVSFSFDGVPIAMVSDAKANRMRLVAAVIDARDMSDQQLLSTMVSNYHLALDARYAIGNGVLFSTYIHPLAELTELQLISAIRQVATLRNTFGTTYTSGEMSFGVQAETEEIDI